MKYSDIVNDIKHENYELFKMLFPDTTIIDVDYIPTSASISVKVL